MKTTAIALIAVFTGVAAQGAEDAAIGRDVTVCLQSGSVYGIARAEALVSEMFADVGVTIRWRRGLHSCPPQAIVVSLSSRTPENLMPGALAYALPFEGVHIQVFFDRIVQNNPRGLVKPLLAHVLVHEITHVLQGATRHSVSGIMKAKWGQKDFDEMIWKPLSFAKEDIDLIDRGLAVRARAVMALNSAPESLATR